MTTKTDGGQFRADFEDWAKGKGMTLHKASPCDESPPYYLDTASIAAWEAYQAGRAALQSQDREDAERYRWLLSKLQQSYDGEDYESDSINIYSRMASQFKGERSIQAEIFWRDKTDEPIGLSEAIDHARRVEGENHGSV